MLKPFVHLIRFPEEIDVCMTGKEKVKPSCLFPPGGTWKSSFSSLTNFTSSAAIKSKSSWITFFLDWLGFSCDWIKTDNSKQAIVNAIVRGKKGYPN